MYSCFLVCWHKIYVKLDKFYPSDIIGNNLLKFELRLDNYIDDMRQDYFIKGLNNLVDLSDDLVEEKMHIVYDMINCFPNCYHFY